MYRVGDYAADKEKSLVGVMDLIHYMPYPLRTDKRPRLSCVSSRSLFSIADEDASQGMVTGLPSRPQLTFRSEVKSLRGKAVML